MNLDQRILSNFTKRQIIEEFYQFKEGKRDKLSDDERYYFAWGSDGVTLRAFQAELERNAEEICRRIYQRRYFFHPLREVIRKDGETGKERTISISTLRDILVQRVLYKVLHEEAEKLFTMPKLNYSSFAYRKGKSAPMAARFALHYLEQGFIHVIDADIQKFFDKIPHDRLKIMISSYFGENSLVSTLLWRFIRTDRVKATDYSGKKQFFNHKPKRTMREEGIPQGGVLSGLIANLYLYPFDEWIIEEIGKNESLRYIRYADDFIVMLKEATILEEMRDIIASRLKDHFGLTLHTESDKTKLMTVTKTPLIFV